MQQVSQAAGRGCHCQGPRQHGGLPRDEGGGPCLRRETSVRSEPNRQRRRVRSLVWLVVVQLLVTACAGTPATPAGALRQPTTTPSMAPTGQSPALSMTEQRVMFHHISVEQGLSQTTVLCMLQDSMGFMWFGTEDGLNKYDGYTFTVYKQDPQDPSSISNNWIQALYEDRSGALWIGTLDGGLDRFDREQETFTHHRHDPLDVYTVSSDEITSIFEDSAGVLWIGTSAGLDKLVHRYESTDDDAEVAEGDRAEDVFIRYQHAADDAHSLSSDAVLSIYEDQEEILWVGTQGGGLNRYDRASESFFHYTSDPADPNSLSHNTIWALYEDQAGTLWVGTDGGLDWYDRERDRFVHYRNDPDGERDTRLSVTVTQVRTIRETYRGELWVGTWGSGLARLDGEAGTFVRYLPNPEGGQGIGQSVALERIWSILQDRSGALWVGTDTQGVVSLDVGGWGFAHYRHIPGDPNTLSNSYVRGIYESRSGILWVGTDGGLDGFDQNSGRWVRYRNDPGDLQSLSDSSVWSILEDRDGNLWLGTRNGLNRLDPTSGDFTRYQPELGDPHSLSDSFVLPIYQDRKGIIWIGTYAGGLNRLDPQTQQFTRYRADPDNAKSLAGDTVMSIYEDQEGALWIGTLADGLQRLDRQSGTFDHFPNDPEDQTSLSHSLVAAIYQDRQGTLWIGTGGGLNRYDPATESFTHYREQDGFPSDVVYGIVEDDAGYLWLSTNHGLSRFDSHAETFRNFDTSDGLQSNEFNTFSFHRGASGRIYFGGVNGLNAFYPGEKRDNPFIPPVVLTSLTQSGRDVELLTSVDSISEVSFSWPNNFFEFEFAALSFIHPEKNQYSYKLEGFDDDWNRIGLRRFGRYTNLPGGTYTLRLTGSNNDGIWNETGTSIAIHIVPPFWETWLFRGIVLAVSAGGILGGYQLRVRSVEVRSRELEQEIDHRTAQLRAETEQRAQAEKALQEREMEQAITAERNRLARDLHDSVTQSLYSLTLLAEAGQRMVTARDLQQIEGNQTRLGDIAQQALQEMRLLVYELRPVALERQGLIGALEQRLETVERRAGIQTRILVHGEIELPVDVEVELYRIAQEALNNSLKHARASTVDLTLQVDGDSVILKVSDDGQGFDPQAMSDTGGLGLVSMKERAERIAGSLAIHSAPGDGTTIVVRVRGDSNERQHPHTDS